MAGNVKKGSITIFLALILSLVLSLVCASIESVRMAAARTQILNSMDIGLYPYLDSMTERFWKIMICLHCMQVEKKNWIWLLYMMIFRLI